MYVRIRAWHVVTTFAADVSGQAKTRCGRIAQTTGDGSRTASALPLGEPSCETCLRLARHDAEKT